jgi:hypothetical protein
LGKARYTAENDQPLETEVEGEIREFMRREVVTDPARQPENESELVANNLKSLLQRATGTSVQEIDSATKLRAQLGSSDQKQTAYAEALSVALACESLCAFPERICPLRAPTPMASSCGWWIATPHRSTAMSPEPEAKAPSVVVVMGVSGASKSRLQRCWPFAWAGLTRTPIGSIRPPMSISEWSGCILGCSTRRRRFSRHLQ